MCMSQFLPFSQLKACLSILLLWILRWVVPQWCCPCGAGTYGGLSASVPLCWEECDVHIDGFIFLAVESTSGDFLCLLVYTSTFFVGLQFQITFKFSVCDNFFVSYVFFFLTILHQFCPASGLLLWLVVGIWFNCFFFLIDH